MTVSILKVQHSSLVWPSCVSVPDLWPMTNPELPFLLCPEEEVTVWLWLLLWVSPEQPRITREAAVLGRGCRSRGRSRSRNRMLDGECRTI